MKYALLYDRALVNLTWLVIIRGVILIDRHSLMRNAKEYQNKITRLTHVWYVVNGMTDVCRNMYDQNVFWIVVPLTYGGFVLVYIID